MAKLLGIVSSAAGVGAVLGFVLTGFSPIGAAVGGAIGGLLGGTAVVKASA